MALMMDRPKRFRTEEHQQNENFEQSTSLLNFLQWIIPTRVSSAYKNLDPSLTISCILGAEIGIEYTVDLRSGR